MLTLLQNITQKLNHLQIPYMLTGSMAMGFYTIPRNTLDLDLVVELNPEDMRAFLQILKNEFYISEDALQTAVAQRGMFNVIDHRSGFKVDMILTQKTLYAQTAFQRAKLRQDLGFELWVISLEDLVLAKIAWIQTLYSDRQIADIEKLLLNPQIDKEYLHYWLKTLQLNTYQIEL